MSADSSWELQKTIYQTLTGDPTLMGMVTGVHDHAPQGAAFPYITIGEATAQPWGAAGLDGIEATLSLHVWSRSPGRKEVKRIVAEMHRLLHDADLAVTGHALVSIRFQFGETFRDPDGITYHGFSRYRAVTHEAA